MKRSTTLGLACLAALSFALWFVLSREHPAMPGDVPAASLASDASLPPAPAPEPTSPAIGQDPVQRATPPVSDSFLAWANAYRAAAPADRAELLAEGLILARARRAALTELIRTDPEGALAASLPLDLRAELPAELLPELEQPVSARGQLAVFETCFHSPGTSHDSPHGNHGHELHRTAVIEGRAYRVHAFGSGLLRRSSDDTPLAGVALDGELALADDAPLLMADTGASNGGIVGAPDAAWTTGDKRLLVIRIDFSDLAGTPRNFADDAEATPAYLDALINGPGGPRDFLQQSSYGQTDLLFDPATDLTPVLRMAQTAAHYATTENPATFAVSVALHAEARAAAATAGYDLEDYDRIAVIYSDLAGLPGSQMFYGGLGNVVGKNIFINGRFTAPVFIHELGHTYGLRHANLLRSTDADPISPTATTVISGDPFNLMGSGSDFTQDFSQWDKALLGWIPDTAVSHATVGGTYRIHCLDAASADLDLPRTLRIRRGDSRNYWIGYRRGQASAALSNGAYVLWSNNSDISESQLLDLVTPLADASDAPLPIGQTFTDATQGISITPVAQGGSGADEWLDLQVEILPRLAWSLSSTKVDEHGGFATLTVTRVGDATNPASVAYATSDGTATAPDDYAATAGTLVWAAGDSEPKTVLLPIVSDALAEPEETFTVTLSAPVGAVVLSPDIVVTIATAGSLDTSFVSSFVNGQVSRVLAEPDGRVLIAGSFSHVGPTTGQYSRVARLGPDGLLDTGFSPGAGPNDSVLALARQPDGKILVGGAFTAFDGTPSNRIARLNTDGSLDSTFNPGAGANGLVNVILVQPDGGILLGGSFTSFDGTPREYLARLLPDGGLDPAFVGPDFFGTGSYLVRTLALQADGKILVGGRFFRSTAPYRSSIARLLPTGALDPDFNGFTNGAHVAGESLNPSTIHRIAVQPDGRIVIAGTFTAYDGVARNRVARLAANGALDAGFDPAVNGDVFGLLLLPDGSFVISGTFTEIGGVSARRIVRLDSAGVFDATFSQTAGFNSSVLDLARLPDGRLLTGGASTSYLNLLGVASVRRIFPGVPARSGVLEFSAATATVAEGSSATLTVVREGGSLGTLTVGYAAVPGSASAADFAATAGTLVWNDGDTAPKTIVIPVPNDGTPESDETFLVRLGHPLIGGALLGAVQETEVTITAPAALVLTGGGLTLLEESGGPLAGNLAPGGVAFAKDVLAVGPHSIGGLNDATYGNSSSWIGNSVNTFAGVSLGATPVPVNRIAFGRDNIGEFSDRWATLYTLQYTTAPDPDASTPEHEWITIGTLDYIEGGITNFTNPALRHLYGFTAVNATGLRLVTAASGMAIDEFEIAFAGTAIEAWRQSRFGTTANAGDAADLADPDGDGIVNLLEYAFGLSPTNPGAGGDVLPVAELQTIADERYLTLTFRRRVGATDLVYTVQTNGDLASPWEADAVQVGSAISNGDGTETVTYRDSVATNDASRRFLRIHVSRTP